MQMITSSEIVYISSLKLEHVVYFFVRNPPKDLDASGGALPAPFLPTAARANTQRAAAPGGGSGPLSGASGDAFVDGPSVTDAQIVVRLPSRRIACGPTLVKAV